MTENHRHSEACTGTVDIVGAEYCPPKPVTSCNCEAHLNKNGVKCEETIRMEGGVPIVSGPVNMNLRSFFVSNPYASGRSTGPRVPYNDPKWKTRTTYKKNRSKTANKNEDTLNAEEGDVSGNAKQNLQTIKVVEVPDPPPRPQINSQSMNGQQEREVTRGKNVAANSFVPAMERIRLAAPPRSDTATTAPATANHLSRETGEIKMTSGDAQNMRSRPSLSRVEEKEEASAVPEDKHTPPSRIPLRAMKTPTFIMPDFKQMLLSVDEFRKPKEKLVAKSESVPNIAAEFKKMVQELAAQDRKKKVAILDYFETIYGRAFAPTPPSGDDADAGKSKEPVNDLPLGPALHVYDDDEDFALPHERPPSNLFGETQWEHGITVTVATVESFEQFIVFDHAGSWRLMFLESDMNRFYGTYLMQKRAEYRELVVDIVKGGYYGVYIEGKNIWARCYVTSVEPPRPEFKEAGTYDPEQEIKAILLDYAIKVQSFKRKQILPLKRFFLHVAIQKIDAQISWDPKSSFPTDISMIEHFRAVAEGQQFHAHIKEYCTETEPLPTAHLELEDPIYDD